MDLATERWISWEDAPAQTGTGAIAYDGRIWTCGLNWGFYGDCQIYDPVNATWSKASGQGVSQPMSSIEVQNEIAAVPVPVDSAVP